MFLEMVRWIVSLLICLWCYCVSWLGVKLSGIINCEIITLLIIGTVFGVICWTCCPFSISVK